MSREIRSPVYQIDFTAVDAGKRIASSKRRIRWRFGFTNQDALAAGETGTACRGEEHDITLIWSITSGKRLVLADGQEVHYSNSRSQVFDFSWTMRGNHVLKVIAHVTTPMNAPPSFRQYDFFVDGMSFFSMPKVYRLGLTGADPIHEPGTLALAHSSRRNVYGNYSMGGGYGGVSVPPSSHVGPSSIVEIEAPHNAQEEEAYLREAIKASLSDQQQREQMMSSSASYQQPQTTHSKDQGDDLLIDFMSEPGPVPAPAAPSTGVEAFAMVPASASVPTPGYDVYGLPPSSQPPAVDPFAAPAVAPAVSPPVPGGVAGSAPVYNYSNFAPTPAPMSSMPAAAAPMPPAPMPAAAAPMPPAAAAAAVPMSAMPPAAAPVPSATAAPVFPYASMGSYSNTPNAPNPAPESAPPNPPPATKGSGSDNAPLLSMQPESKGLGSDANAAYAKFANMDQFDLVKPKSTNRSNPFDDPVATQTSNGGGGTLADMKAKNNSNGGEKKEIMKNSSMAVAQAPASNWNGYNNYGMGMQMGGTWNGGANGNAGSVPSHYGTGYGTTGAPMPGMQPNFSQSNAPPAYGQTYPPQPQQGYPSSVQPQFQQPQQGYGYGQTYPQQSF